MLFCETSLKNYLCKFLYVLSCLCYTVQAFILDLFGNTSVRFEQFNGTTALCLSKARGNLILVAKSFIFVSAMELFKRTIDAVFLILTAREKSPCVLNPSSHFVDAVFLNLGENRMSCLKAMLKIQKSGHTLLARL
jgi:hypothetical protein